MTCIVLYRNSNQSINLFIKTESAHTETWPALRKENNNDNNYEEEEEERSRKRKRKRQWRKEKIGTEST